MFSPLWVELRMKLFQDLKQYRCDVTDSRLKQFLKEWLLGTQL